MQLTLVQLNALDFGVPFPSVFYWQQFHQTHVERKMRHLLVCIFPSILHFYCVVMLQHPGKLQIKTVQNIHTGTDRQGHTIYGT